MYKMYSKIFLTITLIFVFNSIFAQLADVNTLVLDKNNLKELNQSYQKHEITNKKLLDQIIDEAGKLLNQKPLSVIDKSIVPPSGDKHDFTSMGPYWWPDPTKKDGLPYIRRDGERNPEYNKISDQEYFTRTVHAAQLLAVAYYITDKNNYAAKAVELIRVWFLDEKTKMNPNMKHAQFIPGINSGRGIGLIETREIFRVLDAVIILRNSKTWFLEDDKQFTSWISEYYNWITTHEYGITESNEKNNHGTWYDVQRISLALFLNKYDEAKHIIDESKKKRIESQIESDGKQPLELTRTKSWNYSCMNLSAFFHIALLAEKVGIDLWNYEAVSGSSIRKALDYLLPFSLDFSKWSYKQLGSFHKEELDDLLFIGAQKWNKYNYSDWYQKIYNGMPELSFDSLLF